MKRYAHLLQLIDLFRPRTIVEVGTWNGINALRMIQAASKYHDCIEYTGYDLFEEANAQTDVEEFNVKPHFSMEAVAENMKSELSKLGISCKLELIRGNTRQSLQESCPNLAFIDGGHSEDTIASDYSRLCGADVIVLDDYYTPDESGKCPKNMGCNSLIELMPHDMAVRLLPQKDRVSGGGFTQLALVVR